jgi:hypothetical protein
MGWIVSQVWQHARYDIKEGGVCVCVRACVHQNQASVNICVLHVMFGNRLSYLCLVFEKEA